MKKIQQSVRKIKADREMEARYLTLNMYIYEERKKAKAEGRAEGKAEGKAEGTALTELEDIESLLKIKGFMNIDAKTLLDWTVSREKKEELFAMIIKAQSEEEFKKQVLSSITVSA